MKYVWIPKYCFNVHEGCLGDLAICSSKTKAKRILSAHKLEVKRDWKKLPDWMEWKIERVEVI